MSSKLRFVLLIPLASLLGCTLPTAPSSTGTSPTSNWTNWQIQAGAAITSPPNTYPSFLGAMQIQGTQAAGIFTTVNSTGSSAGLDYTGTFNSSTGELGLVTQGFEFAFTQPSTPYTPTPIGVIGGCVYSPTYTGPECTAIALDPSTGVEIAPLNGTYTGTLTESAVPSMSGTGTLTLQ